MKTTLTYLLAVICLVGCRDKVAVNTTALHNKEKQLTPSALLTPSNESWKVSPIHSTSYVDIDNIEYEQENNGYGKPVSVKFEKDGTCIFWYKKRLSEPGSIATIQIHGKTKFSITAQGKNMFQLQAYSGTKNIQGKESVLNTKDLEAYNTNWLWEKISFKDMPSENFLLLVDMNTASEILKMINKNTVCKFYVRK